MLSQEFLSLTLVLERKAQEFNKVHIQESLGEAGKPSLF